MPKQPKQPIDQENINLNVPYTVPDVAECVGWSNRWLRQLLNEGRVKGSRPNGHEWRISGREVQRIVANLDNGGRMPPKRTPLSPENITYIDVDPEQMKLIDPKWGVADPDQQEPPAKKGFFESLNDSVREGNPLLFGGDKD